MVCMFFEENKVRYSIFIHVLKFKTKKTKKLKYV